MAPVYFPQSAQLKSELVRHPTISVRYTRSWQPPADPPPARSFSRVFGPRFLSRKTYERQPHSNELNNTPGSVLLTFSC